VDGKGGGDVVVQRKRGGKSPFVGQAWEQYESSGLLRPRISRVRFLVLRRVASWFSTGSRRKGCPVI
jgi:hypothetical protein